MRRIGLLLILSLPLAAGSTFVKLPLSFEPNQGQTDARVKFLAHVPGYTLFVTAGEVIFAGGDGSVERMTLLGANRKARIEPLEKQTGISNYFLGNDPAKWRTNIPNYGRVAMREVYPGIDLIFYGNARQLEYDWIVAPGADPRQIRTKWEGASEISENAAGDLVLGASLRQRKPLIQQDGRPIEGGYVVRGNEVGLEVAKYDRSKPLVIDPVLLYSTYLGGDGVDYGLGIAVDGSGNAYVTGFTDSPDFPTKNPIQPHDGGNNSNAFVTKINAAGSALVYSTYLGGSGNDQGQGIAVDSSGNAYVTGYTSSTNFPTASPLQSTYGGGTEDAFVTEINAAGSALVYSTYLGGTALDNASAIAVDGPGNAYVTGLTQSTNFPLANALLSTNGGAQAGGTFAGFVTKIGPAGSALVYSTYFSPGYGIAADSFGNAYVTGSPSTDFIAKNPIQTVGSAYVTKIDPTGSTLVYSTQLGGSGSDRGYAIAVDASGSAYVTGSTTSKNFPTVNALQSSLAGGNSSNAFVTKINAAGSAFVYSTYLGGGGPDIGYGIAVDSSGNVYTTGSTSSTNFPTTSPLQPSYGGGTSDGFVTEINATGSAFAYSTYLGGDAVDQANGIAVDGSNAYVTGYTKSNNFPTASPLQRSYTGVVNAFVSLISIQGTPTLSIAKTHVGNFTQGQTGAKYTVTVSNAVSAGPTTGTVTVTDMAPTGLTVAAMSGSGWNCPTLPICTTSNVLNGGLSYPAITVTVSVASNAPASLTNQASVAGGGSASNLASDTTTIAPSTHPAFFNGEAALSGGVYYLQFPDGNVFGYYNYQNFPPFIYSYSLGFEAFIDGGSGAAFLYDFTSGHWWYTSPSLFPYLYDFSLSNWLFFFTNSTSPRYFSDLTTGKIITQ